MIPARPVEPVQRTGTMLPAWCAFGWALGFGVLSLFWAAGGTLGISTLAQTIQDRVDDEDSGFLVLTAITGVLKIGAGLVALATIQRWGSRIPRALLLVLCWAIGVGFTLYGLANLVDKVLMISGARAIPDGMGDRTIVWWYLLWWEPLWTLGGLLFLWAAWTFQRARRDRQEPT